MAGAVAGKVAFQALQDRRVRRLIALTVLAVFSTLVLLLLLLASVIGGAATGQAGAAGASPSDEALADIPANYLALYIDSADRYDIDWSVLAGIGKVECDHGRSPLAGCSPPGTINSAGARGPMQFLGSTWRADADTMDPDVAGPPIPEGQETAGYATDADRDGTADPWTAADAIHAAARLLVRNGAPDYQSALLAYNRDARYVEDVLAYAARYRAPPTNTGSGFPDTNGELTLSTVTCPGGGETVVNALLAPSLDALYTAADADGHQVCGGGHRTRQEQIDLRERNGCPDIFTSPPSTCRTPTAIPGTSMHEQGLAIDFTCAGTLIRSRDNPCSDWLEQHADTYGLKPLDSEPWHYSTTGG